MTAPLEPDPPATERGISLPLSVPRQLVCDLLHHARRIPTVPVQRLLDVSRVRELRQRRARKVSWCVLFTKAYALVCRDNPVLRRAYLEYPRPRLYQHPTTAASVAVEREYGGEVGVFFGYLPRPDARSLAELEGLLEHFKTAPVPDAFRFLIGFHRLPRFVRRAGWWYLLNVRGSRKAEFIGTFGVTVYSGLGAESLHPLSPLTTTLNYGVIGADGRVMVRIVYDHRVMDGATVARALGRLEEAMNGPIARELAEEPPARTVA